MGPKCPGCGEPFGYGHACTVEDADVSAAPTCQRCGHLSCEHKSTPRSYGLRCDVLRCEVPGCDCERLT